MIDAQDFTIEHMDEVQHGVTIVLVRYWGTEAFEGLRLLLIQGFCDRIRELTTLDPSMGGTPKVVAEFLPDAQGHKLARVCAAALPRARHRRNP